VLETAAQKPSPVHLTRGAWGRAPTMFMFGDSSGDPSRSERSIRAGKYYVVCTIAIDGAEACAVDAMVRNLKQEEFPGMDPHSIELHGSALKRTLGEYTHDRHAAEKKFSDIYGATVNIVKQMNAKVSLVVVDKGRPAERSDHAQVERKAWGAAASLFGQTIAASHSPVIGMAILDEYDAATSATVSRAVSRALGPLAPGTARGHAVAVPNPVFAASSSCSLLQLADMIA